MINKRQFRINNNKKLLHKIGEKWVVVSAMTLALLSVGSISTTIDIHAAQPNKIAKTLNKSTQPKLATPENNIQSIASKGSDLHKNIVNSQVNPHKQLTTTYDTYTNVPYTIAYTHRRHVISYAVNNSGEKGTVNPEASNFAYDFLHNHKLDNLPNQYAVSKKSSRSLRKHFKNNSNLNFGTKSWFIPVYSKPVLATDSITYLYGGKSKNVIYKGLSNQSDNQLAFDLASAILDSDGNLKKYPSYPQLPQGYEVPKPISVKLFNMINNGDLIVGHYGTYNKVIQLIPINSRLRTSIINVDYIYNGKIIASDKSIKPVNSEFDIAPYKDNKNVPKGYMVNKVENSISKFSSNNQTVNIILNEIIPKHVNTQISYFDTQSGQIIKTVNVPKSENTIINDVLHNKNIKLPKNYLITPSDMSDFKTNYTSSLINHADDGFMAIFITKQWTNTINLIDTYTGKIIKSLNSNNNNYLNNWIKQMNANKYYGHYVITVNNQKYFLPSDNSYNYSDKAGHNYTMSDAVNDMRNMIKQHPYNNKIEDIYVQPLGIINAEFGIVKNGQFIPIKPSNGFNPSDSSSHIIPNTNIITNIGMIGTSHDMNQVSYDIDVELERYIPKNYTLPHYGKSEEHHLKVFNNIINRKDLSIDFRNVEVSAFYKPYPQLIKIVVVPKIRTITINYMNSNQKVDSKTFHKQTGTSFNVGGNLNIPSGYEYAGIQNSSVNQFTDKDQIITVNLTKRPTLQVAKSTITVNDVDAKTGKLIGKVGSDTEPITTSFDIGAYLSIPNGYQYDGIKNNVDSFDYDNHTITILINKVPKANVAKSTITVKLVDKATGQFKKVGLDTESTTTPFDVGHYLSNLPAGYEYAGIKGNVTSFDYNNHTVEILINKVSVPKVAQSTITVNYVDKNGKLIQKADSDTEDITTPFDVGNYLSNLPHGYEYAGIKNDVSNFDYDNHTVDVVLNKVIQPKVAQSTIIINFIDKNTNQTVKSIKLIKPVSTDFDTTRYLSNIPDNYEYSGLRGTTNHFIYSNQIVDVYIIKTPQIKPASSKAQPIIPSPAKSDDNNKAPSTSTTPSSASRPNSNVEPVGSSSSAKKPNIVPPTSSENTSKSSASSATHTTKITLNKHNQTKVVSHKASSLEPEQTKVNVTTNAKLDNHNSKVMVNSIVKSNNNKLVQTNQNNNFVTITSLLSVILGLIALGYNYIRKHI